MELLFTAKGFGPKSPKLPIIPPMINEKIRIPTKDVTNPANKLGQKILPNEILFSLMEIILIVRM
jgi:hypothetical protein